MFKRLRFNLGFVRVPHIKTVFYFIPTVCYGHFINDHHSVILYFGDIYIELVVLSKETVDNLNKKEQES